MFCSFKKVNRKPYFSWLMLKRKKPSAGVSKDTYGRLCSYVVLLTLRHNYPPPPPKTLGFRRQAKQSENSVAIVIILVVSYCFLLLCVLI